MTDSPKPEAPESVDVAGFQINTAAYSQELYELVFHLEQRKANHAGDAGAIAALDRQIEGAITADIIVKTLHPDAVQANIIAVQRAAADPNVAIAVLRALAAIVRKTEMRRRKARAILDQFSPEQQRLLADTLGVTADEEV